MRWTVQFAIAASLLVAGACQPSGGESGGTGGGASGGSTGSTGGRGGSGAAGRGGSTGGSAAAGSGGTSGAGGSGAAGSGAGGSGGSGAAGTGGGGSGAAGTGGGAGSGAAGTGGGGSGAGGTGTATDAAASETSSGGTPGTTPGMVKIFDGSSWDGWEYDPRCWKIVDKAMHGQCPSGQSQAFTKANYSNFRLIVWSRMVASNDHLGICMWGGRPGAGSYGFAGCLLAQPPGGAFWDYATNKDHPTGGDKSMQNQWHKSEILANRMTGRVLFAVNGKLVHDYKDDQLARRKDGPIGMQIHKSPGNIVEYKDIEIEIDPKEDRLITLTP